MESLLYRHGLFKGQQSIPVWGAPRGGFRVAYFRQNTEDSDPEFILFCVA